MSSESKGRSRLFWESTESLKSREQFITRCQHVMAVIAVGYVLAVLLVSCAVALISPSFHGFAFLLVFDAVGLLLARYLYIVWNARPILIECPECNKLVSSRTPWVCKACGAENRNVAEFPFLDKCGGCGAEPKAYRCHHRNKEKELCGEMIFLSEDRDATNYAWCLNVPEEQPAPDAHATAMQKLRDKKAKKEAQKDVADVEKILLGVRNEIRDLKKPQPTAPEALQAKAERIEALLTKGEELKAYYAKKYKGKKAILDRINALIDHEIMRPKIGED